jgi:parvulin-like peptidyl-prolyl isomerase
MRPLGTIACLGLALSGCGVEQSGAPGGEGGGAPLEARPTSEPSGRVVATVGNGFVTEAEFAEAASHAITPGQTLTPEMRAEVLDELVDDEVLFQKALDQGLYRDEKVRKILINLLLREEVYASLQDEDIPVTELEAYYEAHRDEFIVPEKVQIKRIFIRTGDDRSDDVAKELASDLHTKLTKDPSRFSDLAHEYSDDAYKRRGGDVGYVAREGKAGVPQEVVDKAFEMETGKLSEPFLAGGGYNLVMVAARREALDRTFEQMKGSVLRKLKNERFEAETEKYVAEARKGVAIEVDEATLASVTVEPRVMPPGGLDPSAMSGMPPRPELQGDLRRPDPLRAQGELAEPHALEGEE